MSEERIDTLRLLKEKMPEEETLYDLAELFKVFGDSTRMRILCALFESELSVSEISELLEMSQSAISHQLRVLKQAKLVKTAETERSFIIPSRTITFIRYSIRD